MRRPSLLRLPRTASTLRRPGPRILGTSAAAIAAALALTACGLLAPRPAGPVHFTFTRDFGRVSLATAQTPLPGGRPLTVAAATRRTRPLGPAPAGSAWTLLVNGIAPGPDAAQTVVHPGDRVWWDLRPTVSGAVSRAAIGAFPEPFVHGAGGKRLPATLECAPDAARACDTARRALARIGVPGTFQVLGTGSGTDTIGVVVGTERDLRPEVVAALIARGPAASGVFARFLPGGRGLQLLDERGTPAATLTGSAGLLAATGDAIAEPDWVITGTDPAGVSTAARAFAAGRALLADRLALAVQGDRVFPLPARVRAAGVR